MKMKQLHGIGVCEGVAIGKILKIYSHFKSAPRYNLENDEKIPKEIDRLLVAKERTEKQLEEMTAESKEILSDDFSTVFMGYKLFINDKRFLPAIINTITKDKINAEWALIIVIAELEEQFQKIKDPYIRSRFDDIRQLGERLMGCLQKKPILELSHLKTPVVLVCHDVSPTDAMQLNHKNVLGVVTEMGGETSHFSILARAMNIPAVVGVQDVTNLVSDNADIIIDGSLGEVYENPNDEIIREKANKRQRFAFYQNQLLELVGEECRLKDGRKVKIAANLDFLAELEQIQSLNIASIGLIRTEFLFLINQVMPSEEEQFQLFTDITEAIEHKPITIRTWDIGGDKTSRLFPELQDETNPALGLRAIRICLKHPEIFRDQIRATIRVSENSKVRLMIPMVTRIDEIINTRTILAEEQYNLGISGDNLSIGCMVETPAAAFIIDEILDLVDFISIGSNDLTQFVLAVDRMNEHVAQLFAPFHPAILKILEKIVTSANRRNKDVSICGEMAADPVMQMFLLGTGDITFSMSPNQVLKTKKVLRNVDEAACKKIAFQFVSKHSTAESYDYAAYFRKIYVEDLETGGETDAYN